MKKDESYTIEMKFDNTEEPFDIVDQMIAAFHVEAGQRPPSDVITNLPFAKGMEAFKIFAEFEEDDSDKEYFHAQLLSCIQANRVLLRIDTINKDFDGTPILPK